VTAGRVRHDAHPAHLALIATGLRKSFDTNVVLDGIDLDIAFGSVFALLGPNGAGKTTAVRSSQPCPLLTEAGPSRGFDVVRQPGKVRSVIGVTGQFSAVDQLLTGLRVVVLPFVSSAFVPTATMPSGVAWFARNQPFTPIIQTLRGLLTSTPVGLDAAFAVAWCCGITLLGSVWARSLYSRNRAQ